MAQPERNAGVRWGTVPRTTAAEIDQGLRAYMIKVYNYMAIGLVVTGLVAYASFNAAVGTDGQLTQFGQAIFLSPLRWVVIFAPLAAVFFLSFRIQSMSVGAAQLTFWIYSGLVGLSLSSIFMIYTATSISQVFFVTAAAFAGLSLVGYTTKKDLTAMGSFLIMGLFGIVIASLVNIFLQSSALAFAVSAIGVVVFAGLTAYDTQRIKEMYFAGDDDQSMGRKAIMGALSLYLDFINMFMMLLQLFGDRR